MWQLENHTPFAAERTWVRDRNGTEIWVVAVKCTFDILPDGTTAVCQEQPPVVMAPLYRDPDNPSESSLTYDMDLVRTKQTTDVLLIGHAYAPQGQRTKACEVALRVGSLVKQLTVTGDRKWIGSTMSDPLPFARMPITYERAYGGFDPQQRETQSPLWDVRNPVGTGFAKSAAAADGQRLPNIEYPDQRIKSWNDRPQPAGFGPICTHWQPRVDFAGSYDDRWQQTRFPLLPEDFNDRHYQCAPADQQTPRFLVGNEPVALINLTPQGKLHFQLPRVFLGFETFFFTGERRLHSPPKLHTVILEPDGLRLSLVWHSTLFCHPMVTKLDKTRIFQKQSLTSAGHPTSNRQVV
jgi:hypothetical protein